LLDELVVATSDQAEDDAIVELCRENGINYGRGSLDDVLDRFVTTARPFSPEWVVRLTGDCPLADPTVIDAVVDFAVVGDFDYVANTIEPTYPDGLDVEVVRMTALETAWHEATLLSEREHVTPFLHKQPDRFRLGHLRAEPDLSALRWTVDEPADLEFARAVYDRLWHANPAFGMKDVLSLLEREPELVRINASFTRNQGYAASLENDRMLRNERTYHRSEVLLERALKTIPLGSQTFSKSKTQYPHGVSPYFIQRAKGSHVWDVDGNEYVDFISSLCAVTLGYDDPDVTTAVHAQLEEGVIFSLPHPIEMEVAELIVDMVPCAEMVRFGKNGSDATSGAIRLARAFTGRDHVAVCGYHGWQDWYIGSTARNRGVPRATRDLTHTFAFNDAESLATLLASRPGEFAAVILEPMNVTEPRPDFLHEVRDLAHRHGAVLVFDETITGFRFANGGAQELFGVTPDLATFGKGLANGYPVSAVAGKADIMRLMEEIFFSFTFGGETLSLAAAKATMTKLRREPVIPTLRQTGQQVIDGTKQLIEKHRATDFLAVSGHPTWSFLTIKDAAPYTTWQLKTLFMQEILARGLLAYGTHNISYAHTVEDVQILLGAYDEVFGLMRQVIDDCKLDKALSCKPLEPLFKVR
jgi:glutamate-1-semialdehyde aminotransferase/spore coat polysaccharide biosynthesis protein SpsF (cytidylyltransferase family)